MAKRSYKFAEEPALLNVAVPESTETYVAVSNELALTSIRTGLAQIGMKPVRQEFKLSGNGQIATGRIFLGDPENGIQRCLGFINSYDKSKPFGIACGANVTICENGLFTSEIVKLRKHTKNVLDDLNAMIQTALRYLEVSFMNALQAKEYFGRVRLERNAVSEIIGQLYLEEEIIKNQQLSIIKEGLQNSLVFDMRNEPTLWNLYNLITESLKKSHASTYLEDHVDLHRYMMGKVKEWNLPDAPEPYTLEALEAQPVAFPLPAFSPITSEIDTPETVAQENLTEF